MTFCTSKSYFVEIQPRKHIKSCQFHSKKRRVNEDKLASEKIMMAEGCIEDLVAENKEKVLFWQDDIAILK